MQVDLARPDLLPAFQFNAVPTRAQIERLERELADMPQADIKTRHYFAQGMYAREITIPAGVCLTGQVHKTEHISVLAKGRITVSTDSGLETLDAPQTIIASPGTKRVAICETEVVWITFHATCERDIAKLEAELVEPAERWRAVPGFEDHYSVSSFGNVKSLNYAGKGFAQLLKQSVRSKGYLRIEIAGKSYGVHQLVAAVFIGPCPDGKQVNHKNGIKRDNNEANLEYVTSSQNNQHALDTGLRVNAFGERHYNARLTEADVQTIRARCANGETQTSIARSFGVVPSHISLIKSGQVWRKVG